MTSLSSRLLQAPADAATDLAGGLLALAFGGVALLRGERPLHPEGVTYTALVTSRRRCCASNAHLHLRAYCISASGDPPGE